MTSVTFATALNEDDQWRTKIAHLEDPDISSWVNNLYQDRRFPTRQEFNDAYDRGDKDILDWRNKLMRINLEDVLNFEEIFGDTYPSLIFKMKATIECEKIIFVF